MLPIGTALTEDLTHSGVNGSNVHPAVECQLIGSALRSGRFPGLQRYYGLG